MTEIKAVKFNVLFAQFFTTRLTRISPCVGRCSVVMFDVPVRYHQHLHQINAQSPWECMKGSRKTLQVTYGESDECVCVCSIRLNRIKVFRIRTSVWM
jgi:hypothetical protein